MDLGDAPALAYANTSASASANTANTSASLSANPSAAGVVTTTMMEVYNCDVCNRPIEGMYRWVSTPIYRWCLLLDI